MMHYRIHKRSRGFSLIELMITLVIVGILASVAYPSYRDYVRSGNRTEGRNTLLQVMQAQERYYTRENQYTLDLDGDLGFSSDPVESENEWYNVTAAACGAGLGSCVQLTANAQGAQADDTCAAYQLDSRGNRQATDSGGNDVTEECW